MQATTTNQPTTTASTTTHTVRSSRPGNTPNHWHRSTDFTRHLMALPDDEFDYVWSLYHDFRYRMLVNLGLPNLV